VGPVVVDPSWPHARPRTAKHRREHTDQGEGGGRVPGERSPSRALSRGPAQQAHAGDHSESGRDAGRSVGVRTVRSGRRRGCRWRRGPGTGARRRWWPLERDDTAGSPAPSPPGTGGQPSVQAQSQGGDEQAGGQVEGLEQQVMGLVAGGQFADERQVPVEVAPRTDQPEDRTATDTGGRDAGGRGDGRPGGHRYVKLYGVDSSCGRWRAVGPDGRRAPADR